jgi:hypothetical protein
MFLVAVFGKEGDCRKRLTEMLASGRAALLTFRSVGESRRESGAHAALNLRSIFAHAGRKYQSRQPALGDGRCAADVEIHPHLALSQWERKNYWTKPLCANETRELQSSKTDGHAA